MVDRNGLKFEARDAVLMVDLLRPSEGGLMRKRSGRPSARPMAMTSSVVYIPMGENAPALSP